MLYRFSFFILFFSIIIKLVAIHFTNFDLFGDEAQYLIWSEKIDFGYYSKPPLLVWLIKLYTFFVGDGFVAVKYFPLFFYFFTSYIVYLLSFELYHKKELAIISALSFYLLPSVSISSFLLSTDVVLVFFCSLFLFLLLKITSNPKIINFIILGIFLGLSFLSKYAAVYYLISLLTILFLDKKLRGVFLNNVLGSLIFLISFIIVLLPNILWNTKNGWVTLSHTSDNIGLERININLIQGMEFLFSQVLMLGPLLIFGFVFFISKFKFSFQSKFLLAFSLPVFLIVFLESILVRANANWAAVGLIPMFLFIINHVYIYSKKIILFNNIVNFTFCFILFLLISFSSNLKVFERINGISNFSENLKNNYLQEIDYLIVQDRLLFSSLKYNLRKSNKILLTPHKPNKVIKSHFQMSNPLKSSFNNNFIFIGNPIEINYLEKQYNVIKKEVVNVNFVRFPIEIYEIIF